MMHEAIGQRLASILPDGAVILAHCDDDELRRGGLADALHVLSSVSRAGKRIRILADGMRPFMQATRLLAWRLIQHGVPVSLIPEGMTASMMRNSRIDFVIGSATAIARNGDALGLPGTYGLSVLARHHGIPLYVLAPSKVIQPSVPAGSDFPVEEFPPMQVTHLFGWSLHPSGVPVEGPPLDLTPAQLISGIVTEQAILHPPYPLSIAALLDPRAVEQTA
jgi:methylthioribose-1-phosphate isomerase